MMKFTSRVNKILGIAIALLASCYLQPVSAATDVCSQGTGMPPFLTAGAPPNMLMLLDNSGSMLDMAYSTERTEDITLADGTATEMVTNRCLDGDYTIVDHKTNAETIVVGYVGADTYAGYFEKNSWYKWSMGTYANWQNGVAYTQGDRVYAYGNIYEATSSGTSIGDTIDEDNAKHGGVDWDHFFYIKKWSDDTTFAARSFVWEGPQLYYTELGGISNDNDDTDGRNLSQDIDVAWTGVDSTWQNNTAYNNGDIVTYKGVFYQSASSDGTSSSGTSVYDDTEVVWTSLNPGAFQPIDESQALVHCDNDVLSEYQRAGVLCVTLNENVIPTKVSAFAAQGNFLNWAMSSRFDVQKKILTGGKYNYYEDVMVNEHRGCSGSRFVKQVKLDDDNNAYLTLGVRGSTFDGDDPFMDDRVDSTDDTTRLEIIAVTEDGYQPAVECHEALKYILEHGMTGASLSSYVNTCYETFPVTDPDLADQNGMLNHSLQFCSKADDANLRDVGTITDECKKLYTGDTYSTRPYQPGDLVPAYGAYVCYGIFDAALGHTERDGYIGRCWEGSTGGVKVCEPSRTVTEADGGCNGEGCEFGTEPLLYKNEGDYNYKCTSFTAATVCKTKSGDVPENRFYWEQRYQWDDGSGDCTAGEIAPGGTAPDWENADNDTYVEECITQASLDYCNDTKVPEVIDPSDQAGDTSNYWNVPGLLTDSEVIAQLGATHPMAVLKGYISAVVRPEGVLHQVAQDLRLGAMAFHYVGAATECEPAYLNTGIDKYCPQNNKDGAELLEPVKLGVLVVDDNDNTYESGKRLHVDELSSSINDVRATSWTPLAEAMYGAIGYFTQNDIFCLNRDANNKCLDFPEDDPIDYWCQDNHILVITEGESTADINQRVADFVTDPSSPIDHYKTIEPDDVRTGDVDNDTVADGACAGDNLYSSTYFDDMTWWAKHVRPFYTQRKLPLLDPLIDQEDKGNITTHVVTTGALGDNDDSECTPATIMQDAAQNGGTSLYSGEDPSQLETNLLLVFSNILNRASAGSAASVISSSRSGSGAVYQAIFWPIKTDNDDNTVQWVGDVHAMFMSSEGKMYEDSNKDGILDPCVTSITLANGTKVEIGSYTGGDCDRQVITYYSPNANRTRGCYSVNNMVFDTDSESFICMDDAVHVVVDDVETLCTPLADGSVDNDEGCVEILDIKYLWSANEHLADMDIANDRKIYTWVDANNDGIVDKATEWIRFNKLAQDASLWSWHDFNATAALATPERGSVSQDFLTSDDWSTFVVEGYDTGDNDELNALNLLMRWMNGIDQTYDESDDPVDVSINDLDSRDKKLRSRQFNLDADADIETWRLGDIIHSTPISVSKPAEAYHFIYRDLTYAAFAKKWDKRRNVIYFGSNDGMMHAVNGGFYYEHLNQFCCTAALDDNDNCVNPLDIGGTCDSTVGSYDLGEEMWAYIPQNLQPHLKCLADPSYQHKYFVDQKPRIFDAQIFPVDNDHVEGWGTILVGSMRFGGAPVEPGDWNGADNDDREFTSSFFILDITNPETPALLGEMTRTTGSNCVDSYECVDLNYTTALPTMVVMRNDVGTTPDLADASTDWYLVMGNGPTDLAGRNDNGEQGRIAIFPLKGLTSLTPKPFRIPNTEPTAATGQAGVFLIPQASANEPSFVSDMITVDFDVEQSTDLPGGARYKSDAVYFGTTDGAGFEAYPSSIDCDQTYWNGGGRLFRLVTKVLDVSGKETESVPSDWITQWGDTPDQHNNRAIRQLVDAQAPITAAPSVGYDGHNFWVYAGTGRFYDKKDKTDDGYLDPDTSKISFFGLREPFAVSNTTYNNGITGVSCDDKILSWDFIDWDILTQDNFDLTATHNKTPGQRGLMQSDQLWVVESTDTEDSQVVCVDCSDPLFGCQQMSPGDPKCYPDPLIQSDVALGTDGLVTFTELEDYIAGTGCDAGALIPESGSTGLDGWYRDFHDPRERNVGQAALLGGLLTYTGYQPYSDVCKAEGQSFLYGVHYKTGTAWTESVFGTFTDDNDNGGVRVIYLDDPNPGGNTVYVKDKLSIGKGMATTPSMHVGTGDHAASAFIQTSTGEIIEIQQENLPINNAKSGRSGWSDRCDFP